MTQLGNDDPTKVSTQTTPTAPTLANEWRAMLALCRAAPMLLLFLLSLSIGFEVLLSLIEDLFRFHPLFADAQGSTTESEVQLIVLAATLIVSSALELVLASARLVLLNATLSNGPKPCLNFKHQGLMHLLSDLNHVLIETVRGLASVIIRVPLFLAPAGVEWIRLLPTPFIVLVEPRYQRGELDALKGSREFFRQHWRWVLISLAVMALPTSVDWFISQSMTGDTVPVWQAPGLLMLFSSVTGTLRLIADGCILMIFRRVIGSRTGN